MTTDQSRTLKAVVPTELADEMERRADAEHISLSAWIRRALAHALNGTPTDRSPT